MQNTLVASLTVLKFLNNYAIISTGGSLFVNHILDYVAHNGLQQIISYKFSV